MSHDNDTPPGRPIWCPNDRRARIGAALAEDIADSPVLGRSEALADLMETEGI